MPDTSDKVVAPAGITAPGLHYAFLKREIINRVLPEDVLTITLGFLESVEERHGREAAVGTMIELSKVLSQVLGDTLVLEGILQLQ